MQSSVIKIFILLNIFNYSLCLLCPYPYTDNKGGYYFNYCYYYADSGKNFYIAEESCRNLNSHLVTIKDSKGLDDLYYLYKGYSNYYFWVGAKASGLYPYNFYYADGRPVPADHWCSGHPKGGDNLCAFYTTNAVLGRDRCIQSGPCVAR
jgi:hypothetical protein